MKTEQSMNNLHAIEEKISECVEELLFMTEGPELTNSMSEIMRCLIANKKTYSKATFKTLLVHTTEVISFLSHVGKLDSKRMELKINQSKVLS